MTARLTGIRSTLPLAAVGVVTPASLGGITVADGTPAWSWDGAVPSLPIAAWAGADADAAPEWGVDHVVVTTPDLASTTAALVEVGCDLRRHGTTGRGAPAAFLLAGTLIEVVHVPGIPSASLSGIALETDLPLETLTERWRAAGFEATDPHEAVQPGRAIMSVRGHGLAVMTRR